MAANESTSVTPEAAGQRRELGIRLQPVNQSDQPIFSNFTVVQGAPGTVFVDFAFLEPSALPSLARLAKSGGKLPESINGRLACRIALGMEAAAQLTQQLGQHLASLQPKPQKADPKASGPAK